MQPDVPCGYCHMFNNLPRCARYCGHCEEDRVPLDGGICPSCCTEICAVVTYEQVLQKTYCCNCASKGCAAEHMQNNKTCANCKADAVSACSSCFWCDLCSLRHL